MPNLSCGVCTCGHNDDCMCNLSSIDVSGGASKDNTCCNNFTTSTTASNCACHAAPETHVYCQAKDCVHNNDCTCRADSIDICSCGSECTCHDTKCNSFQQR